MTQSTISKCGLRDRAWVSLMCANRHSPGSTQQNRCQRAPRLMGLRGLTVIITLIGWLAATATATEPIKLSAFMPAPNVVPAVAPKNPVVPAIKEIHSTRRAIDLNAIYDETTPAYFRLQRIDEATRHLTRDSLGFPDWMAALSSGAIAPRANLWGTEKMKILDLDIVMKNTKEMSFVRFPHRSHTLWLDCSNCHPAPFIAKAGANTISMTEIFRGNSCGMCHDRVAFISYFSCVRCHNVAKDSVIQNE